MAAKFRICINTCSVEWVCGGDDDAGRSGSEEGDGEFGSIGQQQAERVALTQPQRRRQPHAQPLAGGARLAKGETTAALAASLHTHTRSILFA